MPAEEVVEMNAIWADTEILQQGNSERKSPGGSMTTRPPPRSVHALHEDARSQWAREPDKERGELILDPERPSAIRPVG
jgi:hypothetical protein